ncbi:MAG: hypothetical protein D4S01_05450 [Dehalococcoidia bacterium]|nr:MAG: hypothetical protein D4S01_05450 [Dehalococcoidia bacterium]
MKISLDELEKKVLDFCFGKKCVYEDHERPNVCKLVVDESQESKDYCPIVKFLYWLREESSNG